MLIKKSIMYSGVKEPKTEKEIEIEIAGLEYVIGVAKENIAIYKQAVLINKLNQEEDDQKKK